MRLNDLAARLVAVEAKLASLTGTTVDGNAPSALDELDARLTIVETTVDHLIAVKTQEHIDAIVSAPADSAPVTVADVVALSPSADVPAAADIVTAVVTDQHSNDAIENPEVAAVVVAAVAAIVQANPEVITEPAAITAAITAAVADAPAPTTSDATAQATAAIADIIATVTTTDTIAPAVQAQIAEAVATPADPVLDAIEVRLNAIEPKVDSLLGK